MAEARSWAEFFSRLKYKPLTSFEYYEYMGEPRVQIIMYVPDSRDVYHQEIPVTQTNVLFDWNGEAHAKDYIRSVLTRMEKHELDEWFRYDGELVNDPHANDRFQS